MYQIHNFPQIQNEENLKFQKSGKGENKTEKFLDLLKVASWQKRKCKLLLDKSHTEWRRMKNKVV